MKCLIAVVLLAVAVPVFAADDAKTEKFTSKEGKFTIFFPGKPTERTKEVDSQGGGKITVFLFIVASARHVHLATYSDFPAKVVKDQGIEATLDNSRDGQVQNSKGKLLKEKKITLGKQKVPGREVLIEGAGGAAYFRSRFFLNGNRGYAVLVSGPEKFVTGKEATAFLDSFKVNE